MTKAFTITNPGSQVSIDMLRAETPADRGAPVTYWEVTSASVRFVSPTERNLAEPAFQMPRLPSSRMGAYP